MARIRTIKPELWTDERLAECSPVARLLFIGMLNFADDNGNQAYSAKRLKMQIFPADSIDTQPLLNELLTQGVIIEYSVSGEKFLHIKGFRTHQVINRPSATSTPQPSFSDDSVSTNGGLTDGREGKGKEGKGEEGIKHTPPAPDPIEPSLGATKAGAVCVFLKSEGFPTVNPGHPVLKALLDAGADIGAFSAAAQTAKAANKLDFGYVLGIVKRQMAQAGEMASTPLAVPTVKPAASESFRERDLREARERWEKQTGRIHPESAKKPDLTVIDAVSVMTIDSPAFVEIHQ